MGDSSVAIGKDVPSLCFHDVKWRHIATCLNCGGTEPEFVLTFCFSVAKENMLPGNSFLHPHQQ